jgi:general stress protein 26
MDNNRAFIENKLSEISSAVMYSESNNIAKLPNDVVMFVKMDDCGQLWFTGHKPRNWVRTYEQNFPAKLFFYRKGVDFYMETAGVASIVNKEEKDEQEQDPANSLLFKMTPSYIEYVEKGKQRPISGMYRPDRNSTTG